MKKSKASSNHSDTLELSPAPTAEITEAKPERSSKPVTTSSFGYTDRDSPAPKAPTRGRANSVPRKGTKAAKVLALLHRPQGVTLNTLCKATGWQTHSMRGFLSGTIRKKMMLKLKSTKRPDRARVYSVRT